MVADIKSERRPASNRNRWPTSNRNKWPTSSESACSRESGDASEPGVVIRCHHAGFRSLWRWLNRLENRLFLANVTMPRHLLRNVQSTKAVIDESRAVQITGQRRPDSGTTGRSGANRDYRSSHMTRPTGRLAPTVSAGEALLRPRYGRQRNCQVGRHRAASIEVRSGTASRSRDTGSCPPRPY
jgi:hypothetical protein